MGAAMTAKAKNAWTAAAAAAPTEHRRTARTDLERPDADGGAAEQLSRRRGPSINVTDCATPQAVASSPCRRVTTSQRAGCRRVRRCHRGA
eukprot:2580703-Prymnesium_polylepis.1